MFITPTLNGSQDGVFFGVFWVFFFHDFQKLAFLQLVFFLQIFKIGVFFGFFLSKISKIGGS